MLARALASLELVPRKLGDSLSGRNPVPTDLPALDELLAHQVPHVALAEPELCRRLGKGDEVLPVQRPPSLTKANGSLIASWSGLNHVE